MFVEKLPSTPGISTNFEKVIIGIALGSYIIDNSAWVAESISEILSLYSIAALRRTIAWLMDWPAGLKLNNELAAFLGDLFLWVIDHWSSKYPFISHKGCY